jgi:hypothetical protein
MYMRSGAIWGISVKQFGACDAAFSLCEIFRGSAGYALFGFLLHVDCGQSIPSYNFSALVQVLP